MGRKKNTPEQTEAATKSAGTSLVRVDADLAYKLGVIVAIEGGTVAEKISPELRPLVEQWYAAALKTAEASKARRKTPVPPKE